MAANVAIVDDDPVTRETLAALLSDEGLSVFPVRSAEDLSPVLSSRAIDLVLLDIRLPGKDGLTLTRELRVTSGIGIILLTSRGDRLDRIVGLEMGADDYIVKPFEPREVLARTRNLLRRIRSPRSARSDRTRTFNGWTIHIDNMVLLDPDGRTVRLTGAEFDLLSTFVANPCRVLSRDYLLLTTRRRKDDANDRTIDSLVRRLRRAIEPDPKDPRLIITVHGEGYMFAADVT